MNAPRRPPRRRVDGVLLLDKPKALTSNAALQTARRLLNAAKAGHTGTLDPLATGLLPLCFGEATKFAGELLDADKVYEAELRLGITTTTADAEGDVLLRRPVAAYTAAQLEDVLSGFQGEIEQVPPMYSALKKDGKALYEYARAGVDIERPSRRVQIYQIDILAVAAEYLQLRVACSKGTYIRTLAEDIGEALGCGAHLSALRRTRIGNLTLDSAVTLAALDELGDFVARDALLAPADALLHNLPCADLPALEAARLMQGQAVRWQGLAGRYRAYAQAGNSRSFLGLCELTADGWLQPRRLVVAA